LAGPYKPGSYQDEEAIKAELRVLTEKTRKLRNELRSLLTGPQTDMTRALVDIRTDPKGASPLRATATDRPKGGRKKR
jgi:hypothetical protein